MPFTIIRQDITKMQVDVIVNAANTDLKMGGGVCGAIFRAAGPRKLQEACDKAAPIKTGEAAITPGFALDAKFVIHAAGPIYSHWSREQSEEYLRAAYINSLRLAGENGCESIAFPLISSGIYGYPKEEALKVATSAITGYLQDHDMDVYLAVFDKSAFAVSEKLMGEVESYIDEHYVDTHEIKRRSPDQQALGTQPMRSQTLRRSSDQQVLGTQPLDEVSVKKHSAVFGNPLSQMAANTPALFRSAEESVGSTQVEKAKDLVRSDKAGKAAAESAPDAASTDEMRMAAQSAFDGSLFEESSLDDIVGELDEPFADTLFRLIDQKGRTDVEVYKRANIDRKLFSKIRSIKGYTPKKQTILALAVALELSLEETDDLLERAGYALSHAVKFDVIVEYFIISGRYDIFEINEVLFKYDQPLLGC